MIQAAPAAISRSQAGQCSSFVRTAFSKPALIYRFIVFQLAPPKRRELIFSSFSICFSGGFGVKLCRRVKREIALRKEEGWHV